MFITGNNTITIDTTKPLIEFGYNVENSGVNVSRNWIYANATLNETNFANLTFYLYNNTNGRTLVNRTVFNNSIREINWTALSDGLYYYNATATDKANNRNSTETREINLDTTYPLISFGFGTANSGTNVSRNWIYVNVTVIEINEANITFSLFNQSGQVNITTLPAGTRTINWTNLNDGLYYYNVTVVDLLSHYNSTETRTITLDTTSPNATLLSPANGTYQNNKTQNLTVNLTDNIGLKNATLYVYNSTNNLINQTSRNVSGTNAVLGIVYEFLYDGIFKWFYRVFDLAGNTFVTNNNTLIIDTTGPDVYLKFPGNGTITSNSTVWFSANFTEINTLKNASLYIWNSSGSLINQTSRDISGTTNSSNISVQLPYYDTFSWNFYACDNLSNCAWNSTNRTLTFEMQQIGINVLYPLGNIDVAINRFFNVTVNVSCLKGDCGNINVSLDPDVWWNPNWSYRKKINIGGTGTQLDDFQILIAANLTGEYNNGKVLSGCQDIRFTNLSGSELNYWVEGCDVTGNLSGFWVKVSRINATGNTGVYMYYGNPSANSKSNGTATFIFFDDFSGDLSKWTVDPENVDAIHINTSLGNPAPSLRHNPDSSQTKSAYFDTRIIANKSTAYRFDNATIDYDLYFAGAPRIIHQFGFRVPSLEFANGYTWRLQSSTADGGWLEFSGATTWTALGSSYPALSTGIWHHVQINVSGSSYAATVDYLYGNSTSDSTKLTQDYIVSHVHGVTLDSSSYVLLDNIRARKYSPILPSYNLNSEEVKPKLGLVSTIIGTIPFYTTTSNPYTTSSLTRGQSETVIFYVNATGSGTYTFFAYANLTSNLTLSNFTNPWNVTIDTFIPQIIIVSPLNQSYNVSRVEFNISSNENLSLCKITLNDWKTNYTMTAFNSSYFNYNNNSIGDSSYTARFYCEDLASNINNTEAVTFVVDAFGPNATLIIPLNGTYLNNRTQNLTVNISDIIGVKNVTLYVYNSTNELVNSTSRNVSGTNAVFGIVYEFLYDGIFNWFYRVFDLAGNTFATQNNTITVDTIFPALDYGSGTLGNYANVSQNFIYANATVNETNFANLTFYLYSESSFSLLNYSFFNDSTRTVNWTGLSDGSYYYNFTVTDKANNKNSSLTRKITLDTSNPLVSIFYPVPRLYAYNITSMNFSASDLFLQACWWSNNSGITNQSINCSTNLSGILATNGNHNWSIYANDSLGHIGLASVSFIVDTTIPEIHIGFPQNTSYNHNITALNYTIINSSALDTCWYSLNGGSNQTVPCLQNITGISSVEGSNTWYFYANNTVGSMGYDFITFVVDTSTPQLSIISPLNDSYYPAAIEFNISGNEALGFCRFTINNWQTNYTMSSFNTTYFNYTNSSIAPGSYTARFWCNDSLGNINNSEKVSFYVTYPHLAINLLYPTSPINVTRSFYFNFSVNVSCDIVDCGDINVTLDPGQNWWDSGWVYRKQLSLTNNNASSILEKGYSINISLNTTGEKFLDNGNDLRIVYYNGTLNMELDRINNSAFNSSSTLIMFKTQANISASSSDSNYYVYYGNPLAGNAPVNRSNIYLFFDAFNDANSWTAATGACSASGVVGNPVPSLFMSESGTTDSCYANNFDLPSSFYILESDVYISNTSGRGIRNIGFKHTASHTSGYMYRLQTSGGDGGFFVLNGAGAWSKIGPNDPDYSPDTWHKLKLLIKGSNFTAWVDDVYRSSVVNSTYSNTKIGTQDDGGADQDSYVDNYLVKRYMYPEPGYTLGAETIEVKGIVNTTMGANPFFTSQNPITISLNRSQSQIVTFWVNATGDSGTYEFFAFINLTRKLDLGNISQKVNVTIVLPIISLIYPDWDNFTGFNISSFNFSINEGFFDNCELWGNWSTGWHKEQTITEIVTNVTLNSSSVNVLNDGFYIWGVRCNDSFGKTTWSTTNKTFSAFLYPYSPRLINISQSNNYGTGNITLFWNLTSHAYMYKIYYSNDLRSFYFLNETYILNYTDTNFGGNIRRFYRIDSWNPIGQNQSANYFGAHVYELKQNGTTRNWIGFPTNFSYLNNANQSLNEIINTTTFTMWNETIQKRVTCNFYSCPSTFECTETNCNFNFNPGNGRSYEVNLNISAPSRVNWSAVGIVYPPLTISLIKNSTSFAKNWISVYANTSLINARGLISNISNADAVSKWDETAQTSTGYIRGPFPWVPYLGTNFSIVIERGYEVSVNQSMAWTQI
jgi:hypothetical protein